MNYDETEGDSFKVDINISDPTKACQNMSIDMTPNVEFVNGIDQKDFIFSDIGDVNITIHEINIDETILDQSQRKEWAKIDIDDTPREDRLIKEYNATFRIIPHHFTIDANLTDHNDVDNFTYLHDINKYESSDDNHSMGATLSIYIEAVGAAPDENITRNYTKECYAKDTNLTLDINATDIIYPGYDQALTQFLYYNPEEDIGEGKPLNTPDTTNAPMKSTITITDLDINNTSASFPDDVPGDKNGTTHIKYKLNFDRKQNLVVNPFKMSLQDVNITDVDDVKEIDGTETFTDKNTTMYYARTRASKFFYEDVTDSSIPTPIAVDIYCDLGFDECLAIGIDTYSAQINEMNWWLSLGHDDNNVNGGDGNITLVVGSPLLKGSGSPTINTQTNPTAINTNIINPITSTDPGIDTNIIVAHGTTPSLPMIVPIELINRIDTPGVSPYTNHWLIYNINSDNTAPSPFYKVEFIGISGWAGHGDTGHVVDSNTSTKKNRRLGW